MQQLFSLAAALSVTFFSSAQHLNMNYQNEVPIQNPDKDQVVLRATEIPVIYQGVTGKLVDYVEPAGTVNEPTRSKKIGYYKKDWPHNENANPNAKPNGMDPALQTQYPAPSSNKALTQNWAAQGYTSVSPADPTVDVGPNHVVQMINGSSGSYIRVYTKTGTPIGSQVYFDNFMGMPGGAGDPIVLYDERADRWILTEFSTSGNNMHVAVSQTPDPSGAYYTYVFNSPGGFPDYPKYSIWDNEYIITANVSSSDIYALNRTALLAGTASSAQMFTMSNFGTIGFQAATPVSLNGTTLPPSGAPAMVMRMRDDAWSGAATDALEVWNVDVDWVTPANSSMTQNIVLGIAPYESELCGYTSFSCIDQPGSSTNLDPLREVLMNRIHYRNFGSHESIVCCHVADVNGADRAGIRWYELRRTGGTSGSWSIYQQGTYSPDSHNRWMPTIGLSESGNIGLAYNVSSSTVYPSIRYTGRKECDPLNQMTEPETTIIAGTSPNSSNRYGDYNAMGCDPSDGETFYLTAMYNTSSSWSTRVAAFSIDVCAQAPEVSFDNSTFSGSEADATLTASACLDYYVVNVPISIGAAPSQNADITIVVTGGTATQNVDYTLNNTSFTLNGANLNETVEVWVYNDQMVEGTETIQLGYTLNANGGNASAGTANQLVDITINDDDLAPASMAGPIVTVLQQDFESGWGTFSTVNPSGATAFQIGNVASTPGGAFDVNPSNTTQFAWIDDDNCNCNQNDVDIVFPSVNLSSYSSATLTFSSYFEDNSYSGINENASLLVSVNGGADQVVGALVSSGVDGPWVAQNYDVSAYAGAGNTNIVFKINYSDGGGWLYGLAVDNILLTGTGPIDIQTAVNTGSGMNGYLGPNQTVHFYDPATSNIMLSIQNTSNFDYGCVTVDVDRPGTSPSAVQFNTTSVPDYLASKTFRIVPTNNNPSGTYNLTVYYKEAEVAAWESFTGNNRANAEIVKVAGNNAIQDVTPANAGTYSISSSPTIVGAFNSDVTFAGAFSTGFSGFGLGIYNPSSPTIPVANFSASTTTVCIGSTVSFTDLSGGNPTGWNWNFGDGNTSTQQNPSHVYASAGTYTVTLVASNGAGSSTPQTSTIVVTSGVTYSQSVELCPGESITVGASTYNSAGTYTDVLSSGGCDSTVTTTVTMLPATSLTQTVNICDGDSYSIGGNTYTSAGTYTDVLTNTAGCDSTVTTTLIVNSLPATSISPASVSPVCSYADPITLNGSPAGGTFSGTGMTGSVFNPATAGAGTHVITYTYTDANGCSGSSTLSIQVNDCSGIAENVLNGVVLHPNPNNGTFVIKGLDQGARFQIFDERGRLILEDEAFGTEQQISLQDVNSGSYYLKSTKDGKEGRIKFLITR